MEEVRKDKPDLHLARTTPRSNIQRLQTTPLQHYMYHPSFSINPLDKPVPNMISSPEGKEGELINHPQKISFST
jgi:hypothetical protein